MNVLLLLLLGAAALAAASTLVKVNKIRDLPDVSNDQFMSAYRLMFEDSPNQVIEERKVIGDYLGVPYQKLSPHQTFKSLSKYTGFLTEYEMGMSDLGDDLAYFCKQAGVSNPDPFPPTVGEFIHKIIRSKRSRDLT